MNTNYLQEQGKIILGSEALILHEDKVLMHKRSDTKKTFPGWWIGPGGHIDKEEDALTAAIREVKEETGVLVSEKDISLKAIAFHYHIDRQELYILFIFRAEISKMQEVSLKNTEGESKWIPREELLSMDKIFPATKYYFDHILNNEPGIMYTNIEWSNSQLVRVSNQRIDNT